MRDIKKIALLAVGDAGWQGGIQYIYNIINSLNAVATERMLEIHLFKHPHQYFEGFKKFENLNLVINNLNEILLPFSFANRIKWFAQRKFHKRIYPRLENYLVANRFDYVFPARLSNCNGKLNVSSWIADFQYHHFPEGANKKIIEQAKNVISDIALNADKIILSSEYCEKDCLRLFPASKGKTYVMPFAVALDESIQAFNDFKSIRSRYSLPEKFMMVANIFAPTKNHKTLFNALGILKKEGLEIPLVCTGNIVDYRNEAFANDILQMLTDNRIRGQVHLLGLIPRDHQLALYRMAIAIVQPSVNEGWSTLVEEAKALGKKLIMSDIEVHQEQYPGNEYMFRSFDAEDMGNKIKELWQKNAIDEFPKIVEEREALRKYQVEVKTFGNRFLEIAEA